MDHRPVIIALSAAAFAVAGGSASATGSNTKSSTTPTRGSTHPARTVAPAPPARPAPASAATTAAASAASPASPGSSPASAGAPLADACPPQLPVRQSIVDDVPGWTTVNQQSSYPFARVAFFPGSPTDTTLIVPTTEYQGKSGLHDTWDLPRHPGGYWVSCRYGDTTATIARKLDDNVDYCQADYDGRFLTLVVKHWTCGEKRLLAPKVAKSPAPPPPKQTKSYPYRHGE